ncbi:dihydrodipicolinate synthase family protein [Anaerocolumna sp. MB42-C2]|uniref:dihydrodipicolinate synthase family protein n=1 Tax=Anaerocolumna sp. MB42-C2 TaxID=3070997 RepID=UPI0027DF3135|nr:dihydrodipicolinate synthase family protein [Anaerocolumna sp. MB42-C2]WMJ86498.1 dihydrodipicolinate synthase family protein [Anaerocolumna sp. MB42-C2]
MRSTNKFSGISAPVLTPFCDNGGVNYKEYEKLIRYITTNGVHSIFVCGTSGEFINLTLEEREELLIAAKEGAAEGTSVMFNITAMNLRDLDRLIEYAKSRKADSVSVTAPYYHKYDTNTLTEYFKTVSEHTGDMPLYLYNMSGMTQNPITAVILKTLLESCNNIKGIKDSSMDFMTILEYQNVVDKKDFEIITGNDAQVLAALQAGASGGIIAAAGVCPGEASKIYEKFMENDMPAARIAQNKIMSMRELFRSVMPVMAHKKALELYGFRMGRARFPFRDLTDGETEIIIKGMKNLGLV